MPSCAPLPWSELLDLPAVTLARRLLGRLYGIGLGYADSSGACRPPCSPAPTPTRQVAVVAGRGEVAWQASALDALRSARGDRPFEHRCDAGLVVVVAPIVVAGDPVAVLIGGGFHAAGDDDAGGDLDLDPGGDRAAMLDVGPGTSMAARIDHPRLGRPERALVAELLAEAAAAAAERLARDGGGPDRHPAGGYATRYAYDAIVGRGAAMQALFRLLDRVIDSDTTVLITGENGTGKELIARAIHHHSARKQGRFVVQNCSAFNDNLLDSELFGHRRGAFTGAVSDRPGLFEVADGGTFFLDEIGDMSPALQVKVLRVLQEGTFTAVGDSDTRHVDVRIVAATHRDLERMVERGEFREDLYYRINVIGLAAPALRDRTDDLPLLVEHFLTRHARRRRPPLLTDACMAAFLSYSWPGNVRELENEIERLIVLAGDEPVIDVASLSPRIRDRQVGRPLTAPARRLPEAIDALERDMISAALERHGGNKTRTAAELGISRRNLIRLCQKYGYA